MILWYASDTRVFGVQTIGVKRGFCDYTGVLGRSGSISFVDGNPQVFTVNQLIYFSEPDFLLDDSEFLGRNFSAIVLFIMCNGVTSYQITPRFTNSCYYRELGACRLTGSVARLLAKWV